MAGYVERDEYSAEARIVGNELDSALSSLLDEAHECISLGDRGVVENLYRTIFAVESVLEQFDEIAGHIGWQTRTNE